MNEIKNQRRFVLLIMAMISLPLTAQQAGEQWEYQGNMEMMGMKMPVPATKVCQPADQHDMTPPVDAESNCSVADIQTEGNTTRFRMVCGEPNPMEGNGTTTRTDDQLTTSYTLTSAEGEMTFTMAGKKLGPCTLN